MCTAITYQTRDFYFGRTLDYDISYGNEITITPRGYCFAFRDAKTLRNHYAIIGMAYVAENYPLYYDAVNEKGLGMAGLNFVGNAVYSDRQPDKCNIASYEFIPWILSQCATVSEAKKLLAEINLTNIPFNRELPLASLHWIIAGHGDCITVESTVQGLNIYDNPVGILTNNPPFPEQMFHLNNFMGLSTREPQNNFCSQLPLRAYSRGMGALGLPGDLSSESRFVRAAFVKMNSVSGDTEDESISQFFHILGSVCQQKGCCCLGDGKYEITYYSSCCNTDKGIYYYTSYDNHQISAICLYRERLNTSCLIRYPVISSEQIRWQN